VPGAAGAARGRRLARGGGERDVQLGNQGGAITLIDGAGLKVSGVFYTAAQARQEGWTIVF